MRALIILPDRNQHLQDWAGAFKPESESFRKMHAIPPDDVVWIDLSKPKAARRAQVFAAIAARQKAGPLEVVAFFCHGLRGSLPQFDLGIAHAPELAGLIASTKAPAVRVALYACSTGGDTSAGGPGGDGGFADALRDSLERAGATQCRVDAHTTAGHATMNPNVRRFEAKGDGMGDVGGRWIVPPGSIQWKAWVAHLRAGTLRFRFPLMTDEEIRTELHGAA